ncbi:type IV pili methyl-accepting chemotaxis transducer N-terminal domain-containing protein [Ideonella sp.]|uniref:type IV pili methyl-accepting chemotaxis transducer N-terminal domain-containing protein n=1 Tax=Ideonella sp. TaxID=1929293 RepID=UPI003BB68849
MSATLHLPSSAPPAVARISPDWRRWQLGKYREIIIAVAFFLLFDLGVLVLNFYTSFQIGQDAVGINLAGRQRMLSQRTAKALFSLEAAHQQGKPTATDLEELRKAVALFDTTLSGFRVGATVPGGDGKPVALAAAEGPQAAEILQKAVALWGPYQEVLAPVLAGEPRPEQLQAAVAYAKANNLKLLGLMNELTTALEAVAGQRASTLRLVQTGGIVLALLNFIFILFKFLRRLQSSDAAAEAANEENREILSSVREGLFLITAELRVGTQLSQSVADLFGRPLHPGENFLEVLAPLVSAKDLEDARGYVDLLFQPHVKESLVQSINPLSQVTLNLKNRLGQDMQRHLSFQFNRALVDGAVRHLLVTVQDVSARAELQAKLAQDRERSQSEFSMLLAAFAAEPSALRQFVARAEEGLLEVNELLRGTSSAVNEAHILKAVEAAARRVHALKGDASMLGLSTLADLAHRFESELQRIRQAGGSTTVLGDALLALPMPLEELLSKVGALKAVHRRVADEGSSAAGGESVNTALDRLVQQAAQAQGKQVLCQVRMGSLLDLAPRDQDPVREIAVQLARNAVSHGIETPAERAARSKAAQGRVEVSLKVQPDGWVLTVRDDGQGLSIERIRAKLVALGWYNQAQLESFNERQILEQIFKPGFSTATALSMHAGRGTGLDVVVANVRQLGARLRLSFTSGEFTEFKVHFNG